MGLTNVIDERILRKFTYSFPNTSIPDIDLDLSY